MAARIKLRFGPYRMPRVKPGQRADCEHAGTIRVVAISDAPVQWPLGVVRGHRIPVLCGDLVRADKQDAACDVSAAWGVSPYLVGQWRKALGVRRTIGSHLRLSEGIRVADPARARKIARAKLGKPRPRHVIEAMRRTHVGRPLPAATRAKMSAAHRRRGTRPPWLKPAWRSWEDKLCRTLPAGEVAKRTGRGLAAVYSRRAILGVTDGRTRAQQRKLPR